MPVKKYNNVAYFNPRSYKRSDSRISLRLWMDWNFNPRSYKRSDVSEAKTEKYLLISIHAPTRGATININLLSTMLTISIHAPTRGATAEGYIPLYHQIFQSTLLQEERQQKCTIFLMHLCNNYCIVSI